MRSCIALPSSSHTCGSRAPGHVAATYAMKSRLVPPPRAWGRAVCLETVLGPLAPPRGDQRRAGIAVAEFGADHFRRLVLLDIGDARELLAPRCTRGPSL